MFQAHETLWLECASKLTTVIQQIIEFAKMVPGFMKLSQDDQIVLLKSGSYTIQDYVLLCAMRRARKCTERALNFRNRLIAGSFELAVLRMSRYIDLTQNLVLYGDSLLPEEAFFTSDTLENKLVSLAFEVSRGVGELKLTEEQLALYSAVVLLSPGWCDTLPHLKMVVARRSFLCVLTSRA